MSDIFDQIEIKQTLPVLACNYDVLRQWAIDITAKYDGLLVTEDQIPAIKKDMAELNKAKQKLERARIDAVKEVSAPIRDFEAQIKAICGIFDDAYGNLGNQIKEFELAEKEEKRKKIQKMIDDALSMALDNYPQMKDRLGLPIDNKWLNKTASMKSIEAEIASSIQAQIDANLTIEKQEQAEQERRISIEKCVINFNEKYGVNLPVAQFMRPEYVSLDNSLQRVLDAMEIQFKHAYQEAQKTATASSTAQENPKPEQEATKKENAPTQAMEQPQQADAPNNLIKLEIYFTDAQTDSVRKILNDNQFMRIVRQLQGAGVKADFNKFRL